MKRHPAFPVSTQACYILYVYLISAVIAAVSNFLLVDIRETSFLDVGTSYNTKTIAVVIGGTAITGGKGGYSGTIAGAIYHDYPG